MCTKSERKKRLKTSSTSFQSWHGSHAWRMALTGSEDSHGGCICSCRFESEEEGSYSCRWYGVPKCGVLRQQLCNGELVSAPWNRDIFFLPSNLKLRLSRGKHWTVPEARRWSMALCTYQIIEVRSARQIHALKRTCQRQNSPKSSIEMGMRVGATHWQVLVRILCHAH